MLGIKNRSECCEIFRRFSCGESSLAKTLAKQILLNEGLSVLGELEFEFFFYIFRDYCYSNQIDTSSPDFGNRIAEYFDRRYGNLYELIQEFNKNNNPKLKIYESKSNYISRPESLQKLINNLRHTEIDIVVKIGNYLLIGEGKLEGQLGAKSKYVLVHQLIRQYVTATILMDIANEKEERLLNVIPFVISKDDLSSSAQVKFMVGNGWLNCKNLFSWNDLDNY